MALLPARRSGQNLTILDPSREFEDITVTVPKSEAAKPRRIEIAG